MLCAANTQPLIEMTSVLAKHYRKFSLKLILSSVCLIAIVIIIALCNWVISGVGDIAQRLKETLGSDSVVIRDGSPPTVKFGQTLLGAAMLTAYVAGVCVVCWKELRVIYDHIVVNPQNEKSNFIRLGWHLILLWIAFTLSYYAIDVFLCTPVVNADSANKGGLDRLAGFYHSVDSMIHFCAALPMTIAAVLDYLRGR